MPSVSVVLPTFNGMNKGLPESVESILCQTWRDLELVVVVDGSNDGTVDWIEGQAELDQRVKVIRNGVNLGLLRSLQRAVDVSVGDLIARQDQDDLSHPTRIALQANFLSRTSEVGLLGTRASVESSGPLSHRGRPRALDHPCPDSEIRWAMLWGNPFVHSSVMFRRSHYDAAGGYRLGPTGEVPEDYDLWTRMAEVARMANLPERLVLYRDSADGLSASLATEIGQGTLAISSRYIQRLLAGEGSLYGDQLIRDTVALLSHGLRSQEPHPIRDQVALLRSLRRYVSRYGSDPWIPWAKTNARLLAQIARHSAN
jgi:glycosyltransferase involved in cell wall biosynthesis